MIKRFAVTIMAILPLLLSACAAASTVTVTNIPTNTVTVTKTVNVTVTATLTPTAAPVTFSGGNDTTTAPFSIDSTAWTIAWSYTTSTPQYAAFSIYIYKVGDSSPITMITDLKPSGSTFNYSGPGQYYFEVNCANLDSWTITASTSP